MCGRHADRLNAHWQPTLKRAQATEPIQRTVFRPILLIGMRCSAPGQIIAEVGASAAAFPSAKQLASGMGACPGNEESAGINYSHRCPKGNRQMRRILNQAANAAVKAKGTIFAIVYRRLVPRLGHAQAIGAIAHPRRFLSSLNA
jgi:transposase